MVNDNLNDDLNDREDLIRATKTIIQLYTDKAHFVYELLQNAEDCKATKVNFTMFPDRLEVLHNGEPFTQDNLTSIRSVAKTTKVEEVNAIGKFGVGFKSVFGICKTVILICEPNHYKVQKSDYLHSFAYKIENFRYLSQLEKSGTLDINLPNEYTTKYIFPFCVDEDFSGYKTMETLHESLSKRLRKLGTSVLLFMKNIEEISYSVGGIRDEWDCKGSYLLEKNKIGENSFKITGIGENDTDDISYLMYSRSTRYNKDVNIAFACEWNKNDIPDFSAAPEKHICVYFPTDTPSNVNFVVQAPYGTTPNRGGIPDTNENIYLNNELAALLRDAILDIRDRKWLTLKFLNFLPLNRDKDYGLLQILHDKMVKLINEERLLHTTNERDYVSKENAYIVRGKEIADLFSDEKLCVLVGNQNAQWLPTYFTDKAIELAELHSILTKQFSVREIEASNLPALLRENAEFLKRVDNEWLVTFYKYLLENQRGMLGAKQEFATVPIIKTKSGEFVEAYAYDKSTRIWKPEVFIFPKNANKVIKGFNFVDEFVVEHCREFLNKMEISEPDEYNYIIAELKNKYDDEVISDEDGVSQLKRAIKCLREEKYQNAIEEFNNRLFLKCVSINGNWNWATCVLKKLYRKNDRRTGVSIIEYFSGTKCEIGVIDEEFYIQNGITPEDLNMLNKLGIKDTVINFGGDSWDDGAQCWNYGDFKRWLNFDYLEDVLNCINSGDKNKSKLLFIMLKKVEDYLKGIYLRGAYRRDRYSGESVIVERIKDKKWLYHNAGNLVRSCDITRNELDVNLYGDVDRYSKLYDILEFKKDNTDVVIELLKDLSEEQRRKILEYLTPRVGEENYDSEDIMANNNDELPTENIPTDINKFTENIIKAFNDAMFVEFAYVTKARSERVSGGGDRVNIEYRYDGFCQKCRSFKGHWEIAEMFLNLNPRKELEQMYLSLCPNCAAEYRQLRNDPAIMENFKQELLNSEYGASEVKLTDNINMYFTQKHLAEIKIILTEMEKSQ